MRLPAFLPWSRLLRIRFDIIEVKLIRYKVLLNVSCTEISSLAVRDSEGQSMFTNQGFGNVASRCSEDKLWHIVVGLQNGSEIKVFGTMRSLLKGASRLEAIFDRFDVR